MLNFASRLSRRSFPVLASVRQRGLTSVRQRGLTSGRWHQAVGLGVALCAVPVVEVPPAPLSLQQFNTQTHLCGLVFPLGLHPLGELGCAASQRGFSSPLCLTGIRREGDGKVIEVSCVAAAELRVPQQRCPDQKSCVPGDRQHGHAALPDHLRADQGAHRVHQGELRGHTPGRSHCWECQLVWH